MNQRPLKEIRNALKKKNIAFIDQKLIVQF